MYKVVTSAHDLLILSLVQADGKRKILISNAKPGIFKENFKNKNQLSHFEDGTLLEIYNFILCLF